MYLNLESYYVLKQNFYKATNSTGATKHHRSCQRLKRTLTLGYFRQSNTRTFLYITKCRWSCFSSFHCNIYTVEAAVRDHLKCQYLPVSYERWSLRSGSRYGALGGKMMLVFLMSGRLWDVTEVILTDWKIGTYRKSSIKPPPRGDISFKHV